MVQLVKLDLEHGVIEYDAGGELPNNKKAALP